MSTTILAKNAKRLYKETIKAVSEWENKSYFNNKKYQPKIYDLLKKIDRAENHIIAVGDAEVERCSIIIALCSEIFKIIM